MNADPSTHFGGTEPVPGPVRSSAHRGTFISYNPVRWALLLCWVQRALTLFGLVINIYNELDK